MPLRVDGSVTYYVIQKYGSSTGNPHSRWFDVGMSHLFFSDLSYGERKWPQTDAWRRIINLQGANTRLWQTYGENGYEDYELAIEALTAARKRRPDWQLRLVCRGISQTTEEVFVPDEIPESFRVALAEFKRATYALDREWTGKVPGDVLDHYPSFLPSFDEFASHVAEIAIEGECA